MARPNKPQNANGMVAENDRDPSRAHWMELFFDLVFVALVAQLASGLHEHPTLNTLFLFTVLFASVWWSWVNLTLAINVTPQLTRRSLGLVMICAMFAVGMIAVAAPDATTDRAWLFALGNALLRVLLLALWTRQSWKNGIAARVRVTSYSGLTAALWLTSMWTPAPINYALWILAIAIEIGLLVASSSRWGARVLTQLNIEHLSERFGLLVIIVLGESVLSTVTALSDEWTVPAGITAAVALTAVSMLAWTFFLYGADAMQEGLESLRAAGNIRAIRDTVAFLPFFLITGITVIAGALAVAIHHPYQALPPTSALSLGGGIALFYLSIAVISMRFGNTQQNTLRWAGPSVALPLALAIAALTFPAVISVVVATIILAIIIAISEVTAHQGTRAQSSQQ